MNIKKILLALLVCGTASAQLLGPGDLPRPTGSILGGVFASSAPANQVAIGMANGTILYGAVPSGAVTLPGPTVSGLGGVYAQGTILHQFYQATNASGYMVPVQPQVGDIAGTIALPAANILGLYYSAIQGTIVVPAANIQGLINFLNYSQIAGTIAVPSANIMGLYYSALAGTIAVPSQNIIGGAANGTYPIYFTGIADFTGSVLAGSLVGMNYIPPIGVAESSGQANIDWSKGNQFYINLNANLNLSFSGVSPGETIVIRITNTGGNYTVTYNAAYTIKWPGGTAPTQTVGAHSDVITCNSDVITTNIYCNSVQNY